MKQNTQLDPNPNPLSATLPAEDSSPASLSYPGRLSLSSSLLPSTTSSSFATTTVYCQIGQTQTTTFSQAAEKTLFMRWVTALSMASTLFLKGKPSSRLPNPTPLGFDSGDRDHTLPERGGLRFTPPQTSFVMSGVALAVGIAGLVVAQRQQEALQVEVLLPSTQTLSAVLQQNYSEKVRAAEALVASDPGLGKPVQSGIIRHVLQPNQTLWTLTQMYKVDAAAITMSNGITSSTPLKAGKTLFIPSQEGIVYSVKKGDTIESIAQDFSVAQRDIVQATPLTNDNFLQVGQKLLIPTQLETLIAHQRAESNRIQQEKDRLEQIMRDQVKASRDKQQSQQLAYLGQPGQSPVQQSRTYTVASGDTIARIATRFGVSQESLININSLKNRHRLKVGQQLTIPTNLSRSLLAKASNSLLPPEIIRSTQNASSEGFIWPIAGKVTSGFGWRGGRLHAGVDIPGPVGTPIVAAMSGTVIFASYGRDGYGNRVDIRHPNGLVTRYAHGQRIYVSQGQSVSQGQVIMSRGSTGWSTGPHLHFEVRPGGGAAVNPMAYLP